MKERTVKTRPILENLTPKRIGDFWACVRKGGPDECWPWAKNTYESGYGLFHVQSGGRRFVLKAHRVAWVLTNGEPDPNLVVMHQCHNRACCNPNHLQLGTIQENNLQMRDARRSLHGARNPSGKLIEEQALEILRFRNEQWVAQALAKRFGVTTTSIRSIWKGISWIHLELPPAF